jgi:hypothetical protein
VFVSSKHRVVGELLDECFYVLSLCDCELSHGHVGEGSSKVDL